MSPDPYLSEALGKGYGCARLVIYSVVLVCDRTSTFSYRIFFKAIMKGYSESSVSLSILKDESEIIVSFSLDCKNFS